MIGASRSGKQNIIEGSERAKTSSETEIKLTDVARASLSELQGDFEDYLVQRGQVPWSIHDENHKAVSAIMLDEFEYSEDQLHDYWVYLLKEKKKFDPWLKDGDDVTAANALIILIQRTTGLHGRQLNRLESDFVAKGGIKEKMYQARVESLPPHPTGTPAAQPRQQHQRPLPPSHASLLFALWQVYRLVHGDRIILEAAPYVQ